MNHYRHLAPTAPLWLACLLLLAAALRVGAQSWEPLSPWFQAQSRFTNWTSQLVQIRTLKSLTQPLISTGQVWFARPNRFRWELGTPPQTIALRTATNLLVIYPRLQRVEQFSLEDSAKTQWREFLSLLDTGFPESPADLERNFQLLSVSPESPRPSTVPLPGTTLSISLQPKSPAARRGIPKFRLGLETNSWNLLWTEMEFADGSVLRNEFFDSRSNVPLEPNRFSPAIPPDYQVIAPLRQR